jgi:hypothetical protein
VPARTNASQDQKAQDEIFREVTRFPDEEMHLFQRLHRSVRE